MPTVTLNKQVVESLIKKKLTLDQLQDRISMLGTDLEKVEGNDIVVEVFPNGNLFVRGEKQLALTGSAETIQVSGIVRPEDIGRNNKVYSRRMANALISYTGTGEVSNAGKVGWGTNLLMKLWPF